MSGKTRSLYGTAFKHFLNSLKPRSSPGVLVGSDQHGNKYYEIAADPSRGKRYPKRWLVPVSEAKYREEMISFEWNAWLRNRRAEPPSESEIVGNVAYSKMLKENADKLDEKEGKKVDTSAKHTNMTSFPVYEEYEVTPGDKQGNFK